MNKNTLKTSLRTLIVLLTVALVAQGVAAAEETTDSGATDGMTGDVGVCLLYTSPSPRDQRGSRMPSSA